MPGAKKNDDDHEYRGNLRTHCSKWHGFPRTFRECCRHVNGVSGLQIWVRQNVWYIPVPRSMSLIPDPSWQQKTHEHASTKVNSNLRIRHLSTDKKMRAYDYRDYRSRCSHVARKQTFVPLAPDHFPNAPWIRGRRKKDVAHASRNWGTLSSWSSVSRSYFCVSS